MQLSLTIPILINVLIYRRKSIKIFVIYVEKNLSIGQLENQVDIIHTEFDTLNYFSNILHSTCN